MKGYAIIDGSTGIIFEDDGTMTIKGTYEEVAFTFLSHMQGSITIANSIHFYPAKKIFEWVGDEKDRPTEFDELKRVFDRVYELEAFS